MKETRSTLTSIASGRLGRNHDPQTVNGVLPSAPKPQIEEAHLNKCCSAIALLGLKEI
jgi:hypothetical protein